MHHSKIFLFLCIFSAQVWAACANDSLIQDYLNSFSKGIPATSFGPQFNQEDAECTKLKIAKSLPRYLGQMSGYKLSFTSAESRLAHDLSEPRWGFMYERNLIDIIAVIPANFGAYPGFDANLIIEVKDEGLAQAQTPLEALKHIESVVPYMELSDRMFTPPFTLNDLVAGNLSFRGGIKSAEIPVQATKEFVDALAHFKVVMTDEANTMKVIASAQGDILMGHPLNAVIWLAHDLKKKGIKLKSGDLISLGSLIEPQKPQPGMKIKLTYVGLPGDPTVEVEFSEANDRQK